MAEWDSLLPEVEEFLETSGETYVRFIRDLVNEVNGIKHRAEAVGLIYAVYTRADKQGGNELKEKWKIAKKLCQWRKDDPSTHISSIHDMVGMTIVVNFPSDRELVAAYLSRPGVLEKFSVVDKSDKKDSGYHAIHLRVQGKNFANDFIVAEIQIKTMLHDGWGAKTHDLTYKPDGSIEENFSKHMEILGDVLRQLDDQSELIKDAIKAHWEVDKKRRAAARDSLFRRLIASRSHEPELAAIAEEIDNHWEELAVAGVQDPRMEEIHGRISRLEKKIGCGRDLCQLITFLASLRSAADMNSTALNAVDRWLKSCPTPIDRVSALTFKSLTYYALGDLEEAVASARKALELAKAHGDETQRITATANLAYFISEFAFGMGHRDPSLVLEAKTLSQEALEAAADPDPEIIDTRGAVLIALGDYEPEVREGLSLCQNAFARAPASEKPVAEAFFKLHERRAFRRLLSWD
jgi:ppGpp synthetase/RelA/SpoT-type nucleotidyltranferase